MDDNLYNGSRLTAHGEESTPKFSIIVPVYNCEKYLVNALESLCSQENFTHNYEIIIIDDGSTDKSGEICDSYASKYDFIRVTHTENYGVSHARNIALKQAQGDYILFCDADDFVSPQLISVVNQAVKEFNQPDLIVYKYFFASLPSKGWIKYDLSTINGIAYNGWDMCLKIAGEIGGYPWSKVIRRKLVENICFDEKLTCCEDEHFFMKFFAVNNNIRAYYIDYCLYCYVQHKGVGLTRQFDTMYSKSGLANFVYATEKCICIKNLDSRVIEQLQYNLYSSAIQSLYHMPVKIKPGTYRKLKLYIKRYGCKYYFRSKAPFKSKLKTFVKHVLFLLRKK